MNPPSTVVLEPSAVASDRLGHAGLSGRQIRFIAIGGAIGAGLFLGSGEAISEAGPSVLMAYGLSGLIVFFVLRALGELTLNDRRRGSFTAYAEYYLGPWCGFATGWSYWLSSVVVGMVELTALGVFAHFWFPELPQWVTALVALILIYTINMLVVRAFGEVEFWLSIAKVAAVIGLILAGVGVLLFRARSGGAPLVSIPGSLQAIFPHGLDGFLRVLPVSFFSFCGVELIGITAGEAEDPQRTVPAAINSVIARILIFYIGSISVIMALVPWTLLGADQSPFVFVFAKVGLPAAAALMNLVLISAVFSACNSGLFATGRVLEALARQGNAPALFVARNRYGVPAVGISASAATMSIGVLLNYAIPSQIFHYLIVCAAVLLLWIWAGIALSQIAFRRRYATAEIAFRMPFYPWSSYAALLFIVGEVTLLIASESSGIFVVATIGTIALLMLIGAVRQYRQSKVAR